MFVCLYHSTTVEPFEVELLNNFDQILEEVILHLSDEFIVEDSIAIHKSARLESGAILKGKIIIGEFLRIGAYASYLRGPIFIGNEVNIGPSSEIKQSLIMDKSAIAHFNYIGNSLIGENVNFEAGSICANHFNERIDQIISVKFNGETIITNSEKFGSLVGDNSRIGANAVLSPGTILNKNSIVKRLELVEQLP